MIKLTEERPSKKLVSTGNGRLLELKEGQIVAHEKDYPEIAKMFNAPMEEAKEQILSLVRVANWLADNFML